MTLYTELLSEGASDGRRLVHVERDQTRAVVTLRDRPPQPTQRRPDDAAPGSPHGPRRRPDPAGHRHHRPRPPFCAGGDLDMIESGARAIQAASGTSDTTDAWRWIRRQFGGFVRTITSTDKIFIAAVNGAAAGVGLAFALACDVIIASERAVLVPAFGRLGLVPEVGTSWLLTRRLGYHSAMALYITGRHIDAAEAAQLGLVQEVHPHHELLPAAQRWCDRISQFPPHALEMTKPLLRAAADAAWEQSLKLEEYAEANCFSTTALPAAAAAIKASTRRAASD